MKANDVRLLKMVNQSTPRGTLDLAKEHPVVAGVGVAAAGTVLCLASYFAGQQDAFQQTQPPLQPLSPGIITVDWRGTQKPFFKLRDGTSCTVEIPDSVINKDGSPANAANCTPRRHAPDGGSVVEWGNSGGVGVVAVETGGGTQLKITVDGKAVDVHQIPRQPWT